MRRLQSDHTGNEVDLLASDDTNLTGVEIKSGSTGASDWLCLRADRGSGIVGLSFAQSRA